MAKTCMILGQSGDGKSTSIIAPPSGEFPKKEGDLIDMGAYMEKYEGMNPDTTVIFNADGKDLPFPYERLGWKEGNNLFTSTYEKPLDADTIEKTINLINQGSKIKSIIIDTINGSMNDKEMLETKKMTFDKWYDLSKNYYKLCVQANSMRKDLIIYMFGHVYIYTDVSGNENRALITNGKRLEKVHLESKVPVVLHTAVELGSEGANDFRFETQKSRSTAKSPIGMFEQFTIPNSLSLVDDKIREYYSL